MIESTQPAAADVADQEHRGIGAGRLPGLRQPSVLKRILRLAYLLRFPLLVLVGLFLLPGLYNTALFRGLADLAWRGVVFVSLMAFLTAAAAVTNANLISLYGEFRSRGEEEASEPVRELLAFGKDPTQPPGPHLHARGLNPPFAGWLFVLGLAAYGNFLYATAVNDRGLGTLAFWLSAAGGVVGGLAIIFLLTWIQLWGTAPIQQQDSEGAAIGAAPIPPGPFLMFPFHLLGLAGVFRRAYNRPPHKGYPFTRRVYALLRWMRGRGGILQFIAEFLIDTGRGYWLDCRGEPRQILPGHVFAALLYAVTLLAHVIGFFWGRSALYGGDQTIPTLTYVVAILLLACWILSSIGFLFDRYPFPSLAVLGLVVVMFGSLNSSDHTYPVRPAAAWPALANRKPDAIFKNATGPIVVVAAAGGGIQAAGWTATVLNGLSAELPEFRSRVGVISSVSGGSVGSYMYLAGHGQLRESGKEAAGSQLTDISEAAMQSSLEAVGWGLAHPDLARLFTPLSFPYDRGLLLERSLARHAAMAAGWTGKPVGDPALAPPTSAPLVHDKLAPKPGSFPVLLINSTSATRGLPFVFSNAKFPSSPDGQSAGIISFHDQVKNYDVQLPTAVRMSATFPYVSPVARANCNCSTDYLADGGYYDNYGIVSALQFLNEAGLNENARVLLLRIESFPKEDQGKADRENWKYQLLAPLLAMYNARTSGQELRDSVELGYYRKAHPVPKIESVTFRYDPTECACREKEPPLSWHLTGEEKRCIRGAWTTPDILMRRSQVKDFLAGQEITEPGISLDGRH